MVLVTISIIRKKMLNSSSSVSLNLQVAHKMALFTEQVFRNTVTLCTSPGIFENIFGKLVRQNGKHVVK